MEKLFSQQSVIIDKLDEIIAIANPQLKQTAWKNIAIYRILPAISIAAITTYLILVDQRITSLPQIISEHNLAIIVYISFGVLFLAIDASQKYPQVNKRIKLFFNVYLKLIG